MKRLILLLIFVPYLATAQIRITEIAPLGTALPDEDGAYSDWIEIENAADSVVSLANLFLSDNSSNLFQWKFPDTVLSAQSRLVVFTSDKNRRIPGGELHTNFKLKFGETLLLSRSDSSVSDAVFIFDLHAGHTQIKVSEQWCYTNSPTPMFDNPAAVCYTGYSAMPQVEPASGFYQTSQQITISGSSVRFTLDGRLPTTSDSLFVQAFLIDSTTTVRAINFEADKLPSVPVSRVYFMQETTNLPVVHITTDPGNLFVAAGGGPAIYDNYQSGEKVECTVSLFDAARKHVFTENAALSIVGNFSLAFAQKSMQFSFDKDYNAAGDVPNGLFVEDKPQIKWLHGFRVRNTDDDAANARMRDAIANRICLPTHAAATASQNVAVFINNRYWGHYVARELLNKYYVRDNFGADPEHMDIIRTFVGATYADVGNMDNFLQIRNFILQNDLSNEAVFSTVEQEIDTQNWTDYWAAQIYLANGDWYSSDYQNNTMCFRAYEPIDTRWKFVLWDLGYSQNLFGTQTATDFNSLELALKYPSYANQYTDMFNGLLRNGRFKNEFINRFADLLNAYWTPEFLHGVIQKNVAYMASEIQPNHLRWINQCAGLYCPADTFAWVSKVQELKLFHLQRPYYQRQHLNDFFDLQGNRTITLDVNPPGSGTIRISTLHPGAYPWSGIYFRGNPVRVIAKAVDGFTFQGWSPNNAIADLTQPEISVNPASTTLIANFTATPVVSSNHEAAPQHTFSLSPNPASDRAILTRNSSESSDLLVRVVNASGMTIFQGQWDDHSLQYRIPLESQDDGTYYVHVSSGDRYFKPLKLMLEKH